MAFSRILCGKEQLPMAQLSISLALKSDHRKREQRSASHSRIRMVPLPTLGWRQCQTKVDSAKCKNQRRFKASACQSSCPTKHSRINYFSREQRIAALDNEKFSLLAPSIIMNPCIKRPKAVNSGVSCKAMHTLRICIGAR